MRTAYLLIALLGIFFTGLLLSLYFYTGSSKDFSSEDALEAIAIGVVSSLLTSAAMGK